MTGCCPARRAPIGYRPADCPAYPERPCLAGPPTRLPGATLPRPTG